MKNKKLSNLKPYPPILIRLGISFVFLWFGLNQLFNPEWGLLWLPELIYRLPIKPITFILINSLFETVFGFLLLIGLFTRIVSLILAIHLIGIIISVGYNDIAVRDFGLMLATLSIFLYGPDRFCLDNKLKFINQFFK